MRSAIPSLVKRANIWRRMLPLVNLFATYCIRLPLNSSPLFALPNGSALQTIYVPLVQHAGRVKKISYVALDVHDFYPVCRIFGVFIDRFINRVEV